MRFHPSARELTCKVVYYGPGLAGKTTNLQRIHAVLPAGSATELVTVDTHSERTLHFDWMAVELGEIQGYTVKIEFWTVPGQSYYAATRRQVLAGADGVVFVADSRREALDENIDAMNEMLGNLRHHGLPEDIPLVMQYNKQDLPTALRREQLEPLMNVRSWPSFAAVAVRGEGVNETMRKVLALVAERAAQETVPPPDPRMPTPAPSAPQTWLISCHRCQTILEVPSAPVGAIYTCGVCASALEVVDSDRGLTRPPAKRQDDSSGFAQIPGTGPGDALAQNPPGVAGFTSPFSAAPQSGAPGGAIDIDGFETVANLDESPQGRRLRVRERSSGRLHRALVISPNLLRQPGYRDSLDGFVRMAGPLRHPNILPLGTLRWQGDTAVLLSPEPAEHEPLSHVLSRRRALAPPHAMGVLRQLALALEEAARAGVVHGWLRPDVVLVNGEGEVQLDELALPKSQGFLVRELAGAAAATEYYLAPESLDEGARPDLRSDIFVLGALLFRMVTGEGLVTGYTAQEALHKVVANSARPLRAAQPGVSRNLDLFYQKLVASERKDRFQTYGELLDQIDQFGGGAQRQNLRLTGQLPAVGAVAPQRSVRSSGSSAIRNPRAPAGGGGSGSSAVRNPRASNSGSGAVRNPRVSSTGGIRRNASGGSGSIARNRQGAAGPLPPLPPPRPKDHTGTIAVVAVVVVLGVAIALYFAAMAQRVEDLPVADEHPAPPTVSPGSGHSPSGTSSAPAGTGAANSRMAQLSRIADLRVEDRFAAADELVNHLDSAQDRSDAHEQIIKEHERRRRDTDAAVAISPDLDNVRRLLEPARSVWGMPGDQEWAAAEMAGAQLRLANAPPPPPTPVATATAAAPRTGPVSQLTGQPLVIGAGAPDQADPAAPATAVAPVAALPPLSPVPPDTVATVNQQIDQALAADQPARATQAINGLPADCPELHALRRKVDLWGKRNALLNRAIQAGSAHLRMSHPTTRESCDVDQAGPDGVDLTSPTGSRTTLPWAQIPPPAAAHLLNDAAALPDANGEERAISVVAWLIAADQTMAGAQAHRSQKLFAPDLAADLDTLAGLLKRLDLLAAATRGNEAIKRNDLRALNDAIVDLRKADPAVQAALKGEIAGFEAAAQQLAARTGAPAVVAIAGPAPGAKDKVDFSAIEDLQSFPDRDGAWVVGGGALTNKNDGHIARGDLGSAHAVSVRFQILSAKGTFGIDFRGAKTVLDLAGNNYTTVGRTTGKPKPFILLPQVEYSLLVERKDDTHTTITFNNGAETADIPSAEASDALALEVTGGGVIAIDEIEILRESGRTAAGAIDRKAAVRVLGWEPIGGAYFEAPSIILPPSAGTSSGIATALKDNISGYILNLKGAGGIRVSFVKADDSKTPGGWEVPLPDKPNQAMELTVRWTDSKVAILIDGKPMELADGGQMPDKADHLMIMATNQATVLTTPKPEYKTP